LKEAEKKTKKKQWNCRGKKETHKKKKEHDILTFGKKNAHVTYGESAWTEKERI